MQPRDRLPFSPITDRPPLTLPDGSRLVLWPVLALEEWDISRPMARTVIPPPQGPPLIPDVMLSIEVGASKPGYFADFKWWLDFPKDADLDLRLEPYTFVRLGEVIRGQIGEAECAGMGYGGWYGQRAPCQRYALTIPASGTLELTLSAPVAAATSFAESPIAPTTRESIARRIAGVFSYVSL
jgi:hypothetical protein